MVIHEHTSSNLLPEQQGMQFWRGSKTAIRPAGKGGQTHGPSAIAQLGRESGGELSKACLNRVDERGRSKVTIASQRTSCYNNY